MNGATAFATGEGEARTQAGRQAGRGDITMFFLVKASCSPRVPSQMRA